jgi:hypothetical protein
MKTLFTRIMQAHLWLGLASVTLTTQAWAADSAPFDIASVGGDEYKADNYIRAAITFQAMGREAACQALLASAKASPIRTRDLGYFVLCRMLFMPRGTNEFRCPHDTHAYVVEHVPDFLLAPIELVDGVPFRLVGNQGGGDGGGPESAENYLRYCMANCDWSTYTFHEATAQQKRDALAKFLSSNKAKQPVTDYQKKFFSAQIE